MTINPTIEVFGDKLTLQLDCQTNDLVEQTHLLPSRILQPLKLGGAVLAGAIVLVSGITFTPMGSVKNDPTSSASNHQGITIYGNQQENTVISLVQNGYNGTNQFKNIYILYPTSFLNESETEAIKIMKNDKRHVIAKNVKVTPKLIGPSQFKARRFVEEEVIERALTSKPNILKTNLVVKPGLQVNKRTKPSV